MTAVSACATTALTCVPRRHLAECVPVSANATEAVVMSDALWQMALDNIAAAKAEGRPVLVESCGAGVQSTTLTLLTIDGLLPKIDLAIFSDTGWEAQEVYDHLDALTRYAAMAGIPILRASKGNLAADVLDPQVYATLPAWTLGNETLSIPDEDSYVGCDACNGDGRLVMVYEGGDPCDVCLGVGFIPMRWTSVEGGEKKAAIKRTCTPKYKIEPLYQTLRELLGARVWDEPCRYCEATGRRVAPWDIERGDGVCSICRGSGTRRRVGSVPAGTEVEQWIGFSRDEWERATSVGFPSWATPRFPLLDMEWTRADCLKWLTEHGWTGVSKSSCVGCPYHDDDTWLEIADCQPDVFADLVDYDRKFRVAPGLRAQRFLHESRLPLDEAIERYRERKRWLGEQLVISDEFKPKRRVRSCNAFGCGTSELEPGEVLIIEPRPDAAPTEGAA